MIELHDVTVETKNGPIVEKISLTVQPGQRVGLIGQSGSGKSTIARVLLGLVAPTRGEVRFHGTALPKLDHAQRQEFRRTIQPVFQDGSETLNPRRSIAASMREALRCSPQRAGGSPRPDELLVSVGLDPVLLKRYPAQLSGGQRQRVSIARALAVQPGLLVLDEPTSALDGVSQNLVISTLNMLSAERGLGFLLISHDLTVAERLCDSAHVLHEGRIVESGTRQQILHDPAHDQTRNLRDAARLIAVAPPRTEHIS
ncbi:MAG: dipeptide/oligopeptide/nickel ABC transporter ATP-binding protein [Mycobacterium sp.]